MAAQVIPFRFDTREVRTLLIDDQPWFVASDVAAALQYRDSHNMCRNLDDDEKGTQIVSTLSGDKAGRGGGEQELAVINESGLYSAILRSRKAEAKRFKKWVTAEVLPAIRKHGHYHDAEGKMGTLIGQTIGTDGFHMLGALIKGKVANLPTAQRRAATAKLWSQTHTAFGVRSAADIPADQLDAARNFVAAYAIEGEYLARDAAPSQRLDLAAEKCWQDFVAHELYGENATHSPLGKLLASLERAAVDGSPVTVGDMSGPRQVWLAYRHYLEASERRRQLQGEQLKRLCHHAGAAQQIATGLAR